MKTRIFFHRGHKFEIKSELRSEHELIADGDFKGMFRSLPAVNQWILDNVDRLEEPQVSRYPFQTAQ